MRLAELEKPTRNAGAVKLDKLPPFMVNHEPTRQSQLNFGVQIG